MGDALKMKKSPVTKRRLLAMALVLSLMFTSVGGPIADWRVSLAEEVVSSEGDDSFESSASEAQSSTETGESEHSDSDYDDSFTSSDSTDEAETVEESGEAFTPDDTRSSDEAEESSAETGESGHSDSDGEDSFTYSDSIDEAESVEESGEVPMSGDPRSSDEAVEPSPDAGPSEARGEGPAQDASRPEDDGIETPAEPTVVWVGDAATGASDPADVSGEAPAKSSAVPDEGPAGEDSEPSDGKPVVVWGESTAPEASEPAVVSGEVPVESTEARGEGPTHDGPEPDGDDREAPTVPTVVWDENPEREETAEPCDGDGAAPGELSMSGDTALETPIEQIPVWIGEPAQETSGADEEEAAAPVKPTAVRDGTSEVTDKNPEENASGSGDAAPGMLEDSIPEVQYAIEAEAAPAEESILQKRIREAVGKLPSLDQRITIILKKNTTYEGDISLEKQAEETYGEGFGIDLVAEDAGDDGLKADATAIIAGSINIRGINLAIRGVTIAAGNKVTVEAAKLSYTGTEKDDTLVVEANEDAEVTVNTGDGNDTVNATAESGAKALDVQTGDGRDDVTVSINGGNVKVDAGDDRDVVKAVIMDGSGDAVTLSGGEGDDEITVANASGKGEKRVEAGAGDDIVAIEAQPGTDRFTVDAGEGSDTVSLYNKQTSGAKHVGAVSVTTGEGQNRVNVDLSLASSIGRVNVTGGKGSDRVHFTGQLDSGTRESQRITGTVNTLKLMGEGGNALTVAAKSVDRFTDELINKRTVLLTPGAAASAYSAEVSNSGFTDYVFTAPVSHLKSIRVLTRDAAPLLAKVVIDSAKTLDDHDRLALGDIDVKGMELLIRGRDIAINGTVKADGVDIVASDGTAESADRAYQNTHRSMNFDVPGLNQAVGFMAGLFDVNDTAAISIGKKAAIYSAGDITLLAKVKQDGGIIRLLPGLNVVNVKVSKASVDVAGKLCAGYDFETGRTGKGVGSVEIGADIDVTAGYDADGKAFEGLPLAVTVASAASGTHIHNGASIEAAGDVNIHSRSAVKVSTRSDSGLGGAPIAIAVSVLNNDVSATVEGRIRADGNVKVSAKGDMDDATSSGKGEGQSSISGGYVSVAVALQNVAAILTGKADVNAGGDLKVDTDARQSVKTTATAGALDSGNGTVSGGITTGVGLLVTFWPQIKEYISEKSAQEKLNEAIAKLASSDFHVKLDRHASSKGEAKVSVLMGDKQRIAEVTVTPWPGYKVKSVTWRGMEPGKATYSYGDQAVDLSGKGKGPFRFALPYENITVFVEYEALSAKEQEAETLAMNPSDLFAEREGSQGANISEIYNDATGGASHAADDEEDMGLGDLFDPIPLKLSGEGGGAVLTYLENPLKQGESLESVKPGAKLELVPNPEKGKALKQGGLAVTYKVPDGKGKPVSKTVIVNADAEGRYIAAIPGDAVDSVSVRGIFVDSGSQDADADTTQFQATGTVAVTVSANDSRAAIDSGAKAKAGGSLTVGSETETDVASAADGTASAKAGAVAAEIEDRAIKKAEQKLYTDYAVGGREYALVIGATQNGRVRYDAKDVGKYIYTFEALPDEGHKVTGARFSFLADGERQSIELKPGKDGKYTLDLTQAVASGLLGKAMDKGSMGEVCFTFGKKDARGNDDTAVTSTHEAQALIANPVRISYNTQKFDEKVDPDDVKYDWIGRLSYTGTTDGKLRFSVKADGKKGFTIDANDPEDNDRSNVEGLWASWVDGSGAEQKAALFRDTRGFYLDPAAMGIPTGALITVNARFTEDAHPLSLDADFDAKKAHGTVTLYDDTLRAGDKPTFTVKADSGYSTDKVTVTYWALNARTNLPEKKTLTLTPDKKGDVTLKDGLPEMVSGKSVYVSAEFKEKNIGLNATGTVNGRTDRKNVTLSESIVSVGNEVTVSPEAELAKQGYKVSGLTLTYTDRDGKSKTAAFDGDSFKVPEDVDEGRDGQGRTAQMNLSATLEKKEIALEEAKLQNGTVSADAARADRGELVSVTVKPDNTFRVKKGTLKAVIETTDGSTSREVYMNRRADNAYTFIMPADIEDPAKVKVTFTGEFEPGQSDSSAVETSLGAGVAVTVANGESRAEIMGGSAVTAGENVAVDAATSGGAGTATKAGYSKGNIGVGGAVSVQVASLDTKALIHKDAAVTVNGRLSMSADSKIKFDVSADASSKDMAGNVGVGAGVAVAVNGADAAAAIEDGATLRGKLTDIALSAVQEATDDLSAKAGSKGGVSVTPAAAVDVTGTSASAYLGKVSDSALKLSGNVSLSADEETNHSIAVDASAAGASAALGGAFDVSVVSDSAVARLNQSVDAAALTLSAVTESAMTGTATAGASGGEKARADKTGSAGQADGQVDGLLSGAAKLAGQNKSQSVSAEKVGEAAANRQKAQTSEGSVAGAAAVAVNIQTGESRAEVLNGIDITTSGKVAVTTRNRTTAALKANASTADSEIGVGAGVAINIITLNNIAHIGDGAITAAALEVAANMKEVDDEPETLPVTGTTDALSIYFGEAVGEYVNRLAKEIGLTAALSEDIVKDLTRDLVQAVTNELIKASGLDDLLGGMNLSDKLKSAEKLINDSKQGLFSLPERLAAPFVEAFRQVQATGDADLERLRTLFIDQLTTQLKARAATLPGRVFSRAKDGMIKYCSENMGDLLSGGFSKETIGKVFIVIYEQTLKATRVELKEVLGELAQEALTRAATELPVLNDRNIRQALELLNGDGEGGSAFDKVLSSVSGYLTTTFRENVFDYEKMLTKIAETDFREMISEGLRAAAKKGFVTLTNTAISRLASHAGVVLEADSVTDKHVFDTQAISGSGAKDVGVAGAVALTIVNGKTEATVAGGKGNVKVNGQVTMNAEEKRKVNNVASAALDARGDADDNKAADTSEDAGSGDQAGTKLEGRGVTVNAAFGGTAEIRPNDLNSVKPKIYVRPNIGYALPGDGKATASYTDDKGAEIVKPIAIKKDGNDYYIDPTDIKTDRNVNITLNFEEVLHAVSGAGARHSGGKAVKADAVKVSAEGREVKDGKLEVRQGELVNVTVQRQKGSRVKEIVLRVADGKNGTKEVSLEPSKCQAGSNGDETIYTFEMPADDVRSVTVVYEDGEEEAVTKDGTGKRVGIGASFAMVYGDSDVTATLGSRSGIHAGTLSISASSDHKEKTASAAGADPLKGTTDTGDKDFALDASVALDLLDNHITAGVLDAGSIDIQAQSGTTRAKDEDALSITAEESSVTDTFSSAYATGSTTAVGATAALNIASSQVDARLNVRDSAKVVNDARISAKSHSEDSTTAIATALGADVQRALNKVADGAKATEDGANKLLSGSFLDKKAEDEGDRTNSQNATADRINARLNKKKAAEGKDASGKLALSSNALRGQDVSTRDASGADGAKGQAGDAIIDATGKTVGTQSTDKTATKFQVAAAVGITIASHEAKAVVSVGESGQLNVRDGSAAITAENTGNFATLGTAAAMSLEKKGNSIAAGVAVGVNKNTARAEMDGTVYGSKDVALRSTLTQNMDGSFRGKLGAQALAGAVAGEDSAASIGGAVSVLVSSAESFAGETREQASVTAGDKLTISATDKSKLALRAGGVSLSKGSSVGMGVSVAVLTSKNNVTASVADGTKVTAKQMDLQAKKLAVTQADYVPVLGLSSLVTDSSKLDDASRDNAETGIFDLKKSATDDNYTVKVNLDSRKAVNAVNALNFLSSTNYYVEAVAGSVMTGGNAVLNAAGAFAIGDMSNVVTTRIGKNAVINIREGAMKAEAGSENNGRVIGGAASLGKAKLGAGLIFTYVGANDRTSVETGAKANLRARDITLQSDIKNQIQNYNAAVAVATGSGSSAAGGAINVIVNGNHTENKIGEGVSLEADNKLKAAASTDSDLGLVSVGVSGATGAVAAGGTVAVIVDEAASLVNVDKNVRIRGGEGVDILSDNHDRLYSILASASGARTAGIAGAVNAMISRAEGAINIEGSTGSTQAGIRARGESGIKLLANTSSRAVNVTAAVAGAGTAAVGASVNVDVFNRGSAVTIRGGRNYKIESDRGEIAIRADGRDTSVTVSAAATGAGTAAVSGNVPVLVSKNTVSTSLSDLSIKSGDRLYIESNLVDHTYAIAGTVAAAGTAGVGVTAVTVLKRNNVTTDLGSVNTESYYSTSVKAEARDTTIVGAGGIAAGGVAGVNGSVATLVNSNTVRADTSTSAIRTDAGSVMVDAIDDTAIRMLAGGITAAGTAAVGASVVTLVSDKSVDAKLGRVENRYQRRGSGVRVKADNHDDMLMLAISAGAAGVAAVEVGAAVQILKSRVHARALKDVESGGIIEVLSNNRTELANSAVALGASGVAAVTPVAVVTYFKGETIAETNPEAAMNVSALGGVINIKADSNKDIRAYTIGAAGSGVAGVSGAATVVIAKDTTKAMLARQTKVNGNNAASLTVDAAGDYKLRTASAAVGAAGVAGIAVNAVVSVLRGNVSAEMAGNADVKGLNVHARGNRDVINAAATVAGAGVAGVGATVMVLSAGAKLSKDAADQLSYGNGERGNRNKTFDASKLTDNYKKNSGQSSYAGELDSLQADLAGDAHSDAATKVGSRKADGKGTTFDAAGGYLHSDFDKSDFDGKGGKQRGEDLQPSETDDVKQAANAGLSGSSAAPEDAVVAAITGTAVVKTDGAVNLTAEQDTRADLFGGNVAVGGVAGVGASVSVATLHSNVAASMQGKIDARSNSVTIKATSSTGDVADEADKTSALKKSLGSELAKKLDLTRRSIRAIGLSVAGGLVGVGAAVAVVRADNVTQAALGGTITNAGDVTVESDAKYENVLAATLSVGGGAVGISGSVAVANAVGDVSAQMNGRVRDGDEKNTLNVHTEGVMKANAIASGAAAGLGAVNAGVAVAGNRLKQTTSIGGDSALVEGHNVNVSARSDTNADATVLSLSAGAVAVNISAGVASVAPVIRTYIGGEGNGEGVAVLSPKANVTISNDISSSVTPKLYALTGGLVAGAGAALLAYNNSDASAAIGNAKLSADSVKVASALKAEGDSELKAATVGAVAAGINVNYVDINAKNSAVIRGGKAEITSASGLEVTTQGSASTAKAAVAALAAGAFALGLNTAIARNRASNEAVVARNIAGSNGDIRIDSSASATASADVEGQDIGIASVGRSFGLALNEASSRASYAQKDIRQNLYIQSGVRGETKASMTTGGGKLIGMNANVVSAYGRTHSTVDVDLTGGTGVKGRTINIDNVGANDVRADIVNGSMKNGFVAAVQGGVAYSQDNYQTNVALKSGAYDLKEVRVNTNTDNGTIANVTPSAGGVSASLAGLNVNLAAAKSTARAETILSVEGTLKTDENIIVETAGKHSVEANARIPTVSISAVNVALNLASADMAADQSTRLRLVNGASVRAGEDLTVQSVNNAYSVKASTGGATNSNGGGAIKFAAADISLNLAAATGRLTSRARIENEGSREVSASGKSLNLLSQGIDRNEENAVRAETLTENKLGLATIGSLRAQALTRDRAEVTVDPRVNLSADGDARVQALTRSSAEGVGSAPGSITLMSGSTSEVKAGAGEKEDQHTAKVSIGDQSKITAGGKLDIRAWNRGGAKASMKQKTDFTLAGVDKSSVPTESFFDTSVVIGKGAELKSGKAMSVNAASRYTLDSQVDADSLQLLLSLNDMKGNNTVVDNVRLDIGEGASLETPGKLQLRAFNDGNRINASTSFQGGFNIIGGDRVEANNNITRKLTVNIGDHARIDAQSAEIRATAGFLDSIRTTARVRSSGILKKCAATAKADIRQENKVNIGAGADISADRNIVIQARASNDFITTEAIANTGGLAITPEAWAETLFDNTSLVNINEKRGDQTEIVLKDPQTARNVIHIDTNNSNFSLDTHAAAGGKAGVGKSKAHAETTANLTNQISIDNAILDAKHSGIELESTNNFGSETNTNITIDAFAEMYAAAGAVIPEAVLKGTMRNAIVTKDAGKVHVSNGSFRHRASNPAESVKTVLNAKYDRNQIEVFGFVLTLTWQFAKRSNELQTSSGCDFCRTAPATIDESARAARNRSAASGTGSEKPAGSAAVEGTRAMQKSTGVGESNLTVSDKLISITKASSLRDGGKSDSELFVLGLHSSLDRDVTLNGSDIRRYRLWFNEIASMYNHLLPNGARIKTGAGGRPQFVTDVLVGDVFGQGLNNEVRIVTPLTKLAVSYPLYAIDRHTTLNLETGELTIPSDAFTLLDTDEISASWLNDQHKAGLIQLLACADGGMSFDDALEGRLYMGGLLQGLFPDGARPNVLWLGRTPEQVEAPALPLYYLELDPDSDTFAIYRTSREVLAGNGQPVQQSLFIYRNDRSDRMGDVVYDAVCYDSEFGNGDARALIVTGLLTDRKLEMPASLQLGLRALKLPNIPDPAWQLDNSVYVVNRQGTASLFDGVYTVTFDGDTFDSGYTRIEGIRSGKPLVTLRKGQPVWPEWTGMDSAADLNGRRFKWIDNQWLADDTPQPYAP